jgi:sorbitol-specific phosphotransferase system component IIBC
MARNQNTDIDATELRVEREQNQSALDARDATIAELRKQISELRNQIDVATNGEGVAGPLAALVREKIKVGLSKEDAIVVAQRQMAHDASMASKNESVKAEAATVPAPVQDAIRSLPKPKQ